MRDETRMLLESMGRLFEDHCTKAVTDAAEAGTFPVALWRAVSESGVPLGGVVDSDVDWSDLYAVLRVAGRYAAPIPLAETMLAGWLASSAGFTVNEQPMTVGPVRAGETLRLERDGNGWRLFGRASRLPWGRDAAGIALIATDPDGRTMVVFGDGVQGARLPTGESNMAGEPRDTYEFAGLGLSGNEVAPAAPGIDQAALYRRGALARAMMMAGAMECALDTAVNYAQDRKSVV